MDVTEVTDAWKGVGNIAARTVSSKPLVHFSASSKEFCIKDCGLPPKQQVVTARGTNCMPYQVGSRFSKQSVGQVPSRENWTKT